MHQIAHEVLAASVALDDLSPDSIEFGAETFHLRMQSANGLLRVASLGHAKIESKSSDGNAKKSKKRQWPVACLWWRRRRPFGRRRTFKALIHCERSVGFF